MKVSDCMTPEVAVCDPDESIGTIAQQMAALDCGVIPLGQNNRLVGVITDRDITIRGIARGKGPHTPAREVMSEEVLYCYDDQDLDDVTSNMADLKIRRMPVVNRDKDLVGILALGDIALKDGEAGAGVFREVSEHGGPHSQDAP
ncbi:CBS domain-containing protein [Cucumibacter marinus]|uniref:CBS domain-containing protein n=1 Tax=Cucumibacter marinus TaxID=1121252 RepID=UPI0003FDFC55|nr:CBS domain-containing protein [Cucumibacter marinus]